MTISEKIKEAGFNAALRGYNRSEVDGFLKIISQMSEEDAGRIAELAEKCEKLEKREREITAREKQSEKTLEKARADAEKIIADAKAEAEREFAATAAQAEELFKKASENAQSVIDKAKNRADEILGKAQEKARELLIAADTESRMICTNAELVSKKLIDDAHIRADGVVDEYAERIEKSKSEFNAVLNASEKFMTEIKELCKALPLIIDKAEFPSEYDSAGRNLLSDIIGELKSENLSPRSDFAAAVKADATDISEKKEKAEIQPSENPPEDDLPTDENESETISEENVDVQESYTEHGITEFIGRGKQQKKADDFHRLGGLDRVVTHEKNRSDEYEQMMKKLESIGGKKPDKKGVPPFAG